MDRMKNFISIQQIRLWDSFHVEYDLQPEVMQYLTIPIILQPIVENAVQHGLSSRLDDGLLRISCKSLGDAIIIEVYNNGAGIPPDRLRQINELLETEQALAIQEEIDFGIGLRLTSPAHYTIKRKYVRTQKEPDRD